MPMLPRAQVQGKGQWWGKRLRQGFPLGRGKFNSSLLAWFSLLWGGNPITPDVWSILMKSSRVVSFSKMCIVAFIFHPFSKESKGDVCGFSLPHLNLQARLKGFDWPKVTQWTSWLSEGLNLGLPGPNPALWPLHHTWLHVNGDLKAVGFATWPSTQG